MPLWRLTPNDQDDPNWAASTYRNELIVRADDARMARLLCARAYGIATQRRLGETVKIVPWNYSNLVAVNQVEATDDCAEEGKQEIVFPPKAVSSAHPGYDRD